MISAVNARARRMRASRSYLLVLALIAATFVFLAAAPDERWSRGALLLIQAATLILALWTSVTGPLGARLVVITVAIAVAAVQLATSDRWLTGTVGVLNGVLIIATAVAIARGVVGEDEVNRQSVVGAICVYVLVGLLFTYVYTVVATVGDGALFTNGTDGTVATRLYFSFVTLTTVGYGDYATATDLGHALSVTEALIGQLYLVTVVAVIVGAMVRRRS
jgi:voltage-gated potassium channel